ncbi:hypothetical protein AB0F92_41450 [Kitasatospora aureofaciens]|uniref:hypothetical protein n=1 Tax=Kitasatospora aureofaciens TaxID=1894 RepID=UPI0033D023D0
MSVALAFGMGIGTTAVVVPGAFSAGEMTAITLRGLRRSLPQAHFTFDAWSITPIQ